MRRTASPGGTELPAIGLGMQQQRQGPAAAGAGPQSLQAIPDTPMERMTPTTHPAVAQARPASPRDASPAAQQRPPLLTHVPETAAKRLPPLPVGSDQVMQLARLVQACRLQVVQM